MFSDECVQSCLEDNAVVACPLPMPAHDRGPHLSYIEHVDADNTFSYLAPDRRPALSLYRTPTRHPAPTHHPARTRYRCTYASPSLPA